MPVPYKITLTASKSWRRNGKNAAKFEVIRIITKRNPIIFPYQKYPTLNDRQRNQPGQVSWSYHHTRPILEMPHWQHHQKANLTLAFLRRNIRSSPPEAKAYMQHLVHVIPSVEYASSVWSSAADSHTNQREMVQERAARFVRNDYARLSSVKEMVTSLHWIILQKRRGMARVTMLYKIKHNIVDVTPDPLIRSARTSRGNPQKHVRNLCTRTTSPWPPSCSGIAYPHK